MFPQIIMEEIVIMGTRNFNLAVSYYLIQNDVSTRGPFTKRDWLRLGHGYVITFTVLCGM